MFCLYNDAVSREISHQAIKNKQPSSSENISTGTAWSLEKENSRVETYPIYRTRCSISINSSLTAICVMLIGYLGVFITAPESPGFGDENSNFSNFFGVQQVDNVEQIYSLQLLRVIHCTSFIISTH
ncbi:hypothetical protein V6N13_120379 [Hibiscus sabdariffa]